MLVAQGKIDDGVRECVVEADGVVLRVVCSDLLGETFVGRQMLVQMRQRMGALLGEIDARQAVRDGH